MSRDAVVAALTAPDLSAVVDLVVWVEDGVAHAANHLGSVRLHRGRQPRGRWPGSIPWRARTRWRSCPTRREIAAAGPRVSTDNAYPYAAQRILSLFGDADRSPDLAVVHTPRHYFPDEGGHAGEHGSLDVIQSRAPLVLSGPGVAPARVRRRPRPAGRRRPRPWPCCPGCRRRTCVDAPGAAARRPGAHGIPRTAARRAAAQGRGHPLGRRALR